MQRGRMLRQQVIMRRHLRFLKTERIRQRMMWLFISTLTAKGKCIGGDRFGNNEGKLPDGKKYKECDIDTLGADSRGAKRIVYSDDGSVYYTDDHYENFEQVY